MDSLARSDVRSFAVLGEWVDPCDKTFPGGVRSGYTYCGVRCRSRTVSEAGWGRLVVLTVVKCAHRELALQTGCAGAVGLEQVRGLKMIQSGSLGISITRRMEERP